jgi:hypothetical protein
LTEMSTFCSLPSSLGTLPPKLCWMSSYLPLLHSSPGKAEEHNRKDKTKPTRPTGVSAWVTVQDLAKSPGKSTATSGGLHHTPAKPLILGRSEKPPAVPQLEELVLPLLR